MKQITDFYKFVVIIILVCVLCLLYSRINKDTFIGYKQEIYMPEKKYNRFINRPKPVEYQITLGRDSKDIILEINKQDIFEYLKSDDKCLDNRIVTPTNNICGIIGNLKLFENNNFVIKSLENLSEQKKKEYLFTILTKCTDKGIQQYYIDYGKTIGMIFLTSSTDVAKDDKDTFNRESTNPILQSDTFIYSIEGNKIGELLKQTNNKSLTFKNNIKFNVNINDKLIAINSVDKVYIEPKSVITKYIIRVFVNGKGPYKYEVEPSNFVETEDFYKFRYKPEYPAANYRFSVTAVNGFSSKNSNEIEIESDKTEREIDYNYADSVISNTQSLQTDVYCMPDGGHILKKRGGNIKKCQMNLPNIYAKEFEKDKYDKYKYSGFSEENYEKLMADITGENKLDYNIEFTIQ